MFIRSCVHTQSMNHPPKVCSSVDLKAHNQNQEKQSPNGSKGSWEIETGTQEVASSIEQELAPQQQEEGQTGRGKVMGLHDQMALNGVSVNGKRSAAVNSPHSISFESPSQMNNGYIQKNEKMSGDYDSPSPSSLSFTQSNSPLVSSEMQGESNIKTPIQEKRTDQETRHVGSIISDNVRNSQSVKTVKRTYQIGQNTGESLRNNIAKFRRKNQ
ncbi:hypothetical protein ACPOM7_18405 [Peribacillus castrilensis]|uniref:hypothetical protein n=1 Tax=Peribacillus TaxID=2675229 RepID=UPI0037C5E350